MRRTTGTNDKTPAHARVFVLLGYLDSNQE